MNKPINFKDKLHNYTIWIGDNKYRIETKYGDVLWIYPYLSKGVLDITNLSQIRINWADDKRALGVPYKMIWGTDSMDNKGLLFKSDIKTFPNFIYWLRSRIKIMYHY